MLLPCAAACGGSARSSTTGCDDIETRLVQAAAVQNESGSIIDFSNHTDLLERARMLRVDTSRALDAVARARVEADLDADRAGILDTLRAIESRSRRILSAVHPTYANDFAAAQAIDEASRTLARLEARLFRTCDV